MEHFGDYLREKRLEFEPLFKARVIAMNLGTSFQAYLAIERGERNLPLKHARTVCDMLEINEEEFKEVYMKFYKKQLEAKINAVWD